jgi:hypothetical protein
MSESTQAKFPTQKQLEQLQDFLLWARDEKMPIAYLDFGNVKVVMENSASLTDVLAQNDERAEPEAVDPASPLSPMYQRLLKSRT